MPLSVCTVSGVLYDATGAAMALETLLIRPRNWVAGSDGIVMPETITEVTDTSGNISVNLTQGIYTVETTRPNLVGRKTFVISVPNAASADIEAIADFTGQSKQAAFLDGTVSLPGFRFQNDLDTGFWLKGANAWGFSAGGVERLDITATGINATVPFDAANGTAGAPTFSFTSDPDTGMYRVGANQLGFAAAGGNVATITSAGMNLTGLLSGTAVTQTSTDDTAGRLLKVGDVGILGTPPVLGGATGIRDRELKGGSYSYSTTIVGQNPDSAASWVHALSVMRLSATQTGGAERGAYLSCRATGSAPNLKLWYGVDSSVAGEINWTELFTQRSILGSVSQSGGVPTGALIETGSNANGFFTRFASGLQLCRRSFAASSSAATTWTFPAAFAAAPDVTGTAQATVLSAVCLDTAPTTTAVTFSARDKNDARRADTCNMLAIGRWF